MLDFSSISRYDIFVAGSQGVNWQHEKIPLLPWLTFWLVSFRNNTVFPTTKPF